MSQASTPFVATANISRNAADALAASAVEIAKHVGCEVSIAVVDGTGSLRSFTRTDSAPPITANVAIAKAWTSATGWLPTHVLNQIVADPEVAPMTQHPGLMAVSGGHPIMHEGHVVGAIGVSGGNAAQDLQIALDALGVAGLAA